MSFAEFCDFLDKHCKSPVAAEGGKEGKVGEEERQWVRPARPVSRDHALSGALKTASPQSMVRLLFTVLDTNGDGNLGKASVRECGKAACNGHSAVPREDKSTSTPATLCSSNS